MNHDSLAAVQPAQASEPLLPPSIQDLFSQLRASDVEQFIHAYQLWTLHQQIDLLELQITLLEQELSANQEQLHLTQPGSIELAALAQLQAKGVSDLDLLDRLHARGELWLDNALQLLEHCERLDMIQGNYTQWCEHALEGAYDWLSSIDDDDLSQAQPHSTHMDSPAPLEVSQNGTAPDSPEGLLLQKLMHEYDEDSLAQEPLLSTSKNGEAEEPTLSSSPSDSATSTRPTLNDLPPARWESQLLSPETSAIASSDETPTSPQLSEPQELSTLSSEELSASPTQNVTQPRITSPLPDPDSHIADVTNPTTPTQPHSKDQPFATPASLASLSPEPAASTLELASLPETTVPSEIQSASQSTPLPEQLPTTDPELAIPSEESAPASTTLPEEPSATEHTTTTPSKAIFTDDQDTLKESHPAKHNRLMHRLLGRMFPKG